MSGKVRCTERSRSRCEGAAVCEENAEVPEDSECGRFILELAMREGEEVERTAQRKRVLDVACGSRMFYFDKGNPDVEFCDIREVPRHEYYPGRFIDVSPDTVCDFTNLPFPDGAFKLVIFDPPHLKRAGDNGWSAMKYGCLKGDWKTTLEKGFAECFRVLDKDGVLVFKWSEVQIPLREILPLSPHKPIFGSRAGKNGLTHWLCFMKPKKEEKAP